MFLVYLIKSSGQAPEARQHPHLNGYISLFADSVWIPFYSLHGQEFKCGKNETPVTIGTFLNKYENDVFISNLTVNIDGNTVYFPQSSFSDCMNPGEVLLKEENRTFVLMIRSCVKSKSYISKIYFTRKKVLRKIKNGPISCDNQETLESEWSSEVEY